MDDRNDDKPDLLGRATDEMKAMGKEGFDPARIDAQGSDANAA